MDHQRLMVTINPKQVTALDTFSACCKQSGGRKLSRACIIRAMARVAKDLDIDVDGCCTEEEFEQRVWRAIEKCED